MERLFRLNWQDLVQKAIAQRKRLGFTQEQVAMMAGVSKPTLNKFERGSTKISVENALKILYQLGLTTRE